MKQTRVQSLVGKIPWRREWQYTPVFLPGKSHGEGSLAGYSPRGGKESDIAEWLIPNRKQTNTGAMGGISLPLLQGVHWHVSALRNARNAGCLWRFKNEQPHWHQENVQCTRVKCFPQGGNSRGTEETSDCYRLSRLEGKFIVVLFMNICEAPLETRIKQVNFWRGWRICSLKVYVKVSKIEVVNILTLFISTSWKDEEESLFSEIHMCRPAQPAV